jgi:hypothetical protein
VVEAVIPFLAERYQLVTVWLGREHWSLTVPLENHIDIGTTVYCALNPDEALYFDTAAGIRIG